MTIPSWVKVALCLVALDLLLFRAGLLWKINPNFGVGLGADNWHSLYSAARDVETGGLGPGTVVAVGSSVVIFGMDETSINNRLRADGTPAALRKIATHGATCTDSALLTWSSRPLKPWLVIYGAAARDFPKAGSLDSSVRRTFYDSSVQLASLRRPGAEALLDGYVRRYWKLYRYRFFARSALDTVAQHVLLALHLPAPSFAAEPPPASVPAEASHYFAPFRLTPQSYAAWAKWRESRQFSDYLTWMQFAPPLVLSLYKGQTVANFGPQGNPEADALRWMLSFLHDGHTRMVLIYFPENPVFRDPQAASYFDPHLSDAYADLFAREAKAHGVRFEDLRNFAQPEDFYDLIHLNIEGERKMSARIAQIIEEEWQARRAQLGARE